MMLTRKKVLLFCVCSLSGILLSAQTVIVEHGKPQAWIKLPGRAIENPDPIFPVSGLESAQILRDYIKKATGAEVSIDKGEESANKIELRTEDGTMDPEGFRIEFPDEKRIVITGGSARGLEYGVYEFLERYAGVRWLFPGELGTEIPKRNHLIVPRKNIKMEPSFYRRFLAGGMHTKEPARTYYHWMVFNRGNFHSRLNTTHYISHLVPPKEYAKTNPEFFPILDGKRFIPNPSEVRWWQPCFTAPGIVDAALTHIPKNIKVLQLGVNDGGRHCECSRCMEMDGNRKNLVGLPDRTKSYLNFCNAIAKERPATTFGFTAYADVMEPSINFKLQPNLIASLTYETFQWLDPERKKNAQNLIARWKKASSGPIGLYDYVYGNHYPFPRIYTRTLASTLKWAHANQVRYLSGEYYPNGDWQDAIKIYVWLKLAWDINADPEVLIEEWCRAAVGEKAAPFLKRYFDRLEKYWTSPEVRKTDWFQKESIYLNWTDPSCLEALPSDLIPECETLLNKVCEYSDNPQRAEYFRTKFREAKPSLLTFLKSRDLRKKASEINFPVLAMKEDFNTPGRKWATWKESVVVKGKFQRDETGGRNLTPAMMIDVSDAKYLSMVYLGYMKAVPDKKYRVSVWVKSENLAPDAVIRIQIRWQKDKKWQNNIYNTKKLVPVNKNWTLVTLLINSPSDEDSTMVLLLSAQNSDNGKVWFDDVVVEMEK